MRVKTTAPSFFEAQPDGKFKAVGVMHLEAEIHPHEVNRYVMEYSTTADHEGETDFATWYEYVTDMKLGILMMFFDAKGRHSEVRRKCQRCGEEHAIRFRQQDWDHWQQGSYIQDALPYLTKEEREMLISRTCDNCWEVMFSDDE